MRPTKPPSRAGSIRLEHDLEDAITAALSRDAAVSTRAFDRVIAAADASHALFTPGRRGDSPDSWGRCVFAGDRGMLHPELTESATATESAEVTASDFDAYVSCNRTRETRMTRATGKQYQHVLEVLEAAASGSAVIPTTDREDIP